MIECVTRTLNGGNERHMKSLKSPIKIAMQSVCIYNIPFTHISLKAYDDAWGFSGGTGDDPTSRL